MNSWGGGGAFTDLPSWSDSFNTKLPSSLNSSKGIGSSGMFDPLSLGLGLGSSVISGLFGMGQAATSASIAKAQLAAQNAAMMEGREQNKGQIAGSFFNKLFDAGTGGDISFGREIEAEKFKRLLAPMDLDIGSQQAKRERLAAISPESKERARFENKLAIERETAARLAQTNAMFGPISSSYSA